jgi:hypothetical protein
MNATSKNIENQCLEKLQKKQKISNQEYNTEPTKCKWCGKMDFHKVENCRDNPANKNTAEATRNPKANNKPHFGNKKNKEDWQKKQISWKLLPLWWLRQSKKGTPNE